MSIETLRQHLKYLAGCDEGGEVMFLRVTREDIESILAHIQPSPDLRGLVEQWRDRADLCSKWRDRTAALQYRECIRELEAALATTPEPK